MAELEYWTIRSPQRGLFQKVKETFERLKANPKDGYDIRYEDPFHGFLRPGGVIFAVGRSLDDLLGYAVCQEFDNEETYLSTFFEDRDTDAEVEADFRKYKEHSTHSNEGELLHVNNLEIFPRRQGIGTHLLDYIKSQNFETIVAEAEGADAAQFYEANDFIDIGIDYSDDFLMMLWNNPAYQE